MIRLYFVGTIISLIFLTCSVFGKVDEQVVPPACPIEFLMIDGSDLPEGWLGSTPRVKGAPVRWGVEKLGVTFLSESAPGVILHAVHRGENYKVTSDGYFELMTDWFQVDEEYNTEWYLPLRFQYKNTIADRYRFGCATIRHNDIEFCQFVGQYGLYITRFETVISSGMTYDDLAHILQIIDDKMTKCLNK